jgi:enoyl-CoA hydratase
VVPDGTALEHAVGWAGELAALPQTCMRNDRQSALAQWGCSEEDAIRTELRLGRDSLASPDAASGATRFAGGAGRSGSSVDRADRR